MRFATSPALGPDGRLEHPPQFNDADDVTRQPDGTCTSELDTYDSGTSPEIAGGTVYWQAYRYCNGCTGGWETGPVRRLVVVPELDARLSAPKRPYAGYLQRFVVRTQTAIAGTTVRLQRRDGKRWKTLASAAGHQGQTVLYAKLPAGRQTLRATVTLGGRALPVPGRTVTVRRPGSRSTGRGDDGAYRAPAGTDGRLRFSVTGGGTVLRGFDASLAVFCIGPTFADNRTQIAFAKLEPVRIAPDGRVLGRLVGSSNAGVVLTGRLRDGRFRGRVETSFSTCSGERKVDARRR